MVQGRARRALDELETKATLADAWLPDNQNDLRMAGTRARERFVEPVELGGAADELPEADCARTIEAAVDGSGSPELEQADGSPNALQKVLASVHEGEEARGEALGVFRDPNAPWARQLLNTSSQPDDVALRGVVHAQVVAD